VKRGALAGIPTTEAAAAGIKGAGLTERWCRRLLLLPPLLLLLLLLLLLPWPPGSSRAQIWLYWLELFVRQQPC